MSPERLEEAFRVPLPAGLGAAPLDTGARYLSALLHQLTQQ
jgi:hypothetical protein